MFITQPKDHRLYSAFFINRYLFYYNVQKTEVLNIINGLIVSCAVKFAEIYDQHKSLVFNLALQYVQNTEDAEEITQDVFLIVHEKLEAFRMEAKVSTWLYRITINKSLDFIKAKKRQKRFSFFTSL